MEADGLLKENRFLKEGDIVRVTASRYYLKAMNVPFKYELETGRVEQVLTGCDILVRFLDGGLYFFFSRDLAVIENREGKKAWKQEV